MKATVVVTSVEATSERVVSHTLTTFFVLVRAQSGSFSGTTVDWKEDAPGPRVGDRYAVTIEPEP